MKKIILIVFIFSIIPQFTACKSDEKKVVKKETVEKVAPFSLKTANNKINFVAYKFTEKTGVKGKFKKVNITSGGEGNTAKEAIHNAEFSIPLSSLFTSDSSRDYKIRTLFFGVMDKTTLLSGKLVIENDSLGYANIKMNNVTKKLPFTYSITGKEFSMSATMDVNNWNAQDALASLNTACLDLHKGADGVSKTWPDVAIAITSTFK
jgi:hypothetical protein